MCVKALQYTVGLRSVDPAELHAAGTRAFLRSVPKMPSNAQFGSPRRVVAANPSSRPGHAAVGLAGMARLRLFERVARHATSLRLFAAPGDANTGWQLDVPGVA